MANATDLLCLVGLLAALASPVVAATGRVNAVRAESDLPSVLPAQLARAAPCVSDAAVLHRVNPWILKAILKVESGFNANAINRNANGSVDVGMAQINSIHFSELARWGIAPGHLMDGCVATYVAAWHLAKQMRKHGDSWFGVASYHSTTPCQNARYAALVWNALLNWGVVQGQRMKVVSLASCGYVAPSKSTSRAGGRRTRSNEAAGRSAPAVAFDAGDQ